ncbi:MAG: 30S ribosomal protein S12 methylthiotransferase RimO [Candidatus Accumulibacter sp.]|jgi:ribosomal protein S12 methylthiotransferase|nr:30S ribosomal protein S12 methylthiotransferase RimO [Accumulibacter sp.]
MNDPGTPNIGFVSLGCPKALVDSERLLTRLRAEGYAISPTYAGADLVVVNTCGFIDAAIDESLEAIGEALRENGKVIVTGCLGTRRERVREAYPDVLAITGPHADDAVLQHIHAHLPPPRDFDPSVASVPPQGIRLTPTHFAYLKISEGCDHSCTFCVIPALRGPLVSRPIDEVLREAERLVEAGARELLVIAQDTGAYGVDLKHRTGFVGGRPVKTRLAELCAALSTFGVWVRLHYVYPYPGVDALIPLMAEGKLLPYLDVPLQHASPRVLKAMRRPANAENSLERIRAWRAICPEITIRSTFITGFPGETEAEFEELLAFLEEARLDRVGCFAYSPVDGAAANALPGAVPDEVREERRRRLMEVQEDISAELLAVKIGHEITVLVDEVDDEGTIARSMGDAPEIDGLVLLDGHFQAGPGDFLRARVVDADAHDLYAEVVDEE